MPKVFNLLSPRTPWRLFCELGYRFEVKVYSGLGPERATGKRFERFSGEAYCQSLSFLGFALGV